MCDLQSHVKSSCHITLKGTEFFLLLLKDTTWKAAEDTHKG